MQVLEQHVSPEVQKFLSSEPIRMYIDGRWTFADDGDVLQVFDPGEGKVIATVASGKASDIDRAVQAARTAFRKSGWSTMPANDRAVILHKIADLIDRSQEILAQIESLDVGKPLAQAKGFDIPDAARTIRYYADLSVHTRRREPILYRGWRQRPSVSRMELALSFFPGTFPSC